MSSPASDTRTRILAATLRLLLEREGRNLRMSDVAAAAGLSRQAVYLHFESRAKLMVATARYGDEVHHLDERLRRYRAATTGTERLERFIEFWGNYLPEIYGVARALLAARDANDDVAEAWNDRMSSIRDGCRETVAALERDGVLTTAWASEVAVDILWALLSVRTWEDLTGPCDWSTGDYVERITALAKRALVQE